MTSSPYATSLAGCRMRFFLAWPADTTFTLGMQSHRIPAFNCLGLDNRGRNMTFRLASMHSQKGVSSSLDPRMKSFMIIRF